MVVPVMPVPPKPPVVETKPVETPAPKPPVVSKTPLTDEKRAEYQAALGRSDANMKSFHEKMWKDQDEKNKTILENYELQLQQAKKRALERLIKENAGVDIEFAIEHLDRTIQEMLLARAEKMSPAAGDTGGYKAQIKRMQDQLKGQQEELKNPAPDIKTTQKRKITEAFRREVQGPSMIEKAGSLIRNDDGSLSWLNILMGLGLGGLGAWLGSNFGTIGAVVAGLAGALGGAYLGGIIGDAVGLNKKDEAPTATPDAKKAEVSSETRGIKRDVADNRLGSGVLEDVPYERSGGLSAQSVPMAGRGVPGAAARLNG